MKFAVISDIHGNAPALRLALADASQHGVDGYLLAGDYCISAPWANEVVDIIRALPNAHVIRGNDEAHLDVAPGDDAQFAASRWCAGSLSRDNKAWLDALPDDLELDCEGATIRMAHSSQAFVGKALHERFRTSVMPSFYPNGPADRETLLADFRLLWDKDSFRESIRSLSPGVYIFGHNHIQAWGTFDGRTLIDPGSCGLPLDCCGYLGAAYSLLTIADGQVQVEERRIPYDVETLITQAMGTGQYEAAPIWSEIIFSEWRTGREKVYQFLHHCQRYAESIGDMRRPFARDTWEAAYALWTIHAREWHPQLFVS